MGGASPVKNCNSTRSSERAPLFGPTSTTPGCFVRAGHTATRRTCNNIILTYYVNTIILLLQNIIIETYIVKYFTCFGTST